MIDESKLIFFTGAPGSKWSAVSNMLSMTPMMKVNITDRSEARTHTHPVKFNSAQHLGSYFGPGFEFGQKWHELHTLTKQDVLDEIALPWTDEQSDSYRIVKCHQMVNNLDWIIENFPTSKIIIVMRPIQSCYNGWFGGGGFDITYPNYADHYKNDETARDLIDVECRDAREWVFNKRLRLHAATERHWDEYWDINNFEDNDKVHRCIRSIEGYMFAHKTPHRQLVYDTLVAYYNFEDINKDL
tara:strand:- start:1784 stop:2512 length:729 start_codon:yes stop_codon:yes gene_type:complete